MKTHLPACSGGGFEVASWNLFFRWLADPCQMTSPYNNKWACLRWGSTCRKATPEPYPLAISLPRVPLNDVETSLRNRSHLRNLSF